MEALLVTVDDAAQMLAISRRKLCYLMKDGKVPYMKVGRAVRISTRALKEYVEQLSAKAS